MISYLARRVLGLVPLLIGITFVSFFVIQLAPGSPVDVATDLNPKASAEVRERMQKIYGLDQPLPVQYWRWLKRISRGDFGVSFAPDGRPVAEKIRDALPITLLLNVMSLCLIMGVGIPIGILSATRQYSLPDRVTTVFVFIGFAMPGFWFALLCMLLFGVELGWLPISGLESLDYAQLTWSEKIMDRAQHLIMPVGIAGLTGLAGISRYMRSSMLEVVRQDYVTTARAKGLQERTVIYKHALRNALLPVITILGLSVPSLIGGSVIFEQIFAIPGMGRLFYDAVMSRDYPLVMGILVIGAVLTLLGNLLADVSYAVADPRLRRR
ncbi:MAG: ABC transporter permease [Myxococcales bacterium]|nr:MAG: ABC transporter permease [Myxococcales bacterium]